MGENLNLENVELSALSLHLYKHLKDRNIWVSTNIDTIVKLINEILFAKFGFKWSSLWGFQRKDPYFSDTHMESVRKLKELTNMVRKVNDSNQRLDIIHRKANAILKWDSESLYINSEALVNEKWNSIASKYKKLGVDKSEYELRKIIEDLLYAVKM